MALTTAGEVAATVGDVCAPEYGGILLLDPATGADTVLVDAGIAIESPAGAIIQDGKLITLGLSLLSGFELANGTLLWTWSTTSPIVDLAAVTAGFAAVPTADRSVVVTLP